MNLKKRFAYAGMAAALALSLTTPTFAANANNVVGNGVGAGAPMTGGKGGETIISIFETDVDPSNVSFEVPLYVTLAVVETGTNPKVVAPTSGYYIKNTGVVTDTETPASIGVTAMYIASLGEWEMSAAAPAANSGRKIQLTFTAKPNTLTGAETADITMPLIDLDKGKWGSVDVKANNSIFTKDDGAGGKYYRPIKPSFEKKGAATTAKDLHQELNITIAGAVDPNYSINKTTTAAGDAKAVPQFRVTYVVSALDANGKPIGNAYVGNDYGPAPDFAMLENGNVPVSRYYDKNNATGADGEKVNDPIKGSTGITTKP